MDKYTQGRLSRCIPVTTLLNAERYSDADLATAFRARWHASNPAPSRDAPKKGAYLNEPGSIAKEHLLKRA